MQKPKILQTLDEFSTIIFPSVNLGIDESIVSFEGRTLNRVYNHINQTNSE